MLKRLPPFYAITIFLTVITVICLIYPSLISYYLLGFALLAALVLLIIHLFLAWPRLAVTSRLGILLSIIAWLGILYGLVYSKDLSIWKFFS